MEEQKQEQNHQGSKLLHGRELAEPSRPHGERNKPQEPWPSDPQSTVLRRMPEVQSGSSNHEKKILSNLTVNPSHKCMIEQEERDRCMYERREGRSEKYIAYGSSRGFTKLAGQRIEPEQAKFFDLVFPL